MVSRRFGAEARRHVEEMAKSRLPRRLLEKVDESGSARGPGHGMGARA